MVSMDEIMQQGKTAQWSLDSLQKLSWSLLSKREKFMKMWSDE